ncbi:MAG: DNA polymerase III subunit delta [Clostridia bacterium]|nr:DNA polymerase III subunit delta [Clostridia bacterium]
MKFAELKQSLKNEVKNAYFLVGKDCFLLNQAEKLITKKCVSNFFEINVQKFNDENFDIEKLLNSLNSAPFGDDKKVVVLSEINLSLQEQKTLKDYLKNQNKTTCFIIKSVEQKACYKSLIEYFEVVDCENLDAETLRVLIVNKFLKNGIKIDSYATKTIIDYCNYDMSFIEKECEKLIAYGKDKKIITEQDVKNLVHKNIEYSIFELSNLVAEKNSHKAFELLELMLENKESPQNLLGLLLANFRRIFYVSITKLSETEMAKLLGVKEYSIKIARTVGNKFTPKKLKYILDLGGKIDFDIKNGKCDEKNGLYFFITQILL